MSTSALEIGLHVLNAYTNRIQPAKADEAYLRELAGDATTPVDELACQIIQAELRKARAQKQVERVMRQHMGAA